MKGKLFKELPLLQNGLYKASFSTPSDSGDGVIYLQDGHAYGGDSCFYYSAKYNAANNKINAEFKLNRHTQGDDSVFGVDNIALTLAGTCDDKTALLSAQSAAGLFQVTLTLLIPAKNLTTTV